MNRDDTLQRLQRIAEQKGLKVDDFLTGLERDIEALEDEKAFEDKINEVNEDELWTMFLEIFDRLTFQGKLKPGEAASLSDKFYLIIKRYCTNDTFTPHNIYRVMDFFINADLDALLYHKTTRRIGDVEAKVRKLEKRQSKSLLIDELTEHSAAFLTIKQRVSNILALNFLDDSKIFDMKNRPAERLKDIIRTYGYFQQVKRRIFDIKHLTDWRKDKIGRFFNHRFFDWFIEKIESPIFSKTENETIARHVTSNPTYIKLWKEWRIQHLEKVKSDPEYTPDNKPFISLEEWNSIPAPNSTEITPELWRIYILSCLREYTTKSKIQ